MSRFTGRNIAGMSCDDEAVYWQARIMSGLMSKEENFLFERWLEASAENKNAFSNLENALLLTDGVAEDMLASEFENELNQRAQEGNFSINRFAAMAATFLMVGVSIAAIILFDVLPSQKQIYVTAVGERGQYNLIDGSQIELNTNSTVEVQYGRNARTIALSNGQAIFVVERDRERPFVVSTAQADIVVTGTVFDVCVFDNISEIKVITGAVTVKPNEGRQVTLLAGDSLLINSEGVAGPVQHFDPYTALAWRYGKLVFDEAPLEEVVAELNRYFQKPIVIEETALSLLPVTGEFDVQEQDVAVRALSLIFSLQTHVESNRIILSRASE